MTEFTEWFYTVSGIISPFLVMYGVYIILRCLSSLCEGVSEHLGNRKEVNKLYNKVRTLSSDASWVLESRYTGAIGSTKLAVIKNRSTGLVLTIADFTKA